MLQGAVPPREDSADAVATHLAAAKLDDMPETRSDLAKKRLPDSVDNSLAGVDATGNQAARDVFLSYGSATDATVFGSGARAEAPHVALLNSMAMRSYGYEAIGAESADASMVAARFHCRTHQLACLTNAIPLKK